MYIVGLASICCILCVRKLLELLTLYINILYVICYTEFIATHCNLKDPIEIDPLKEKKKKKEEKL